MMKTGGPLTIVIVGLMFFGAGMYVNYWASKQEARVRLTSRWPKLPAKVVSAEVVQVETVGSDGTREYQAYPRIVYSYSVGGQVHTNETQKPLLYVFGGFAHANRMMERFPIGSTVSVRVNPENPNDTELEGMDQERRGTQARIVAILTMGLGGLVTVMGIVFTMRSRKRLATCVPE